MYFHLKYAEIDFTKFFGLVTLIIISKKLLNI